MLITSAFCNRYQMDTTLHQHNQSMLAQLGLCTTDLLIDINSVAIKTDLTPSRF